MQLILTPNANSIYSIAERTGIADKKTTATNTTVSVMLASQKTHSVDVTTCAVLVWSVCLDLVGKPWHVEHREQDAGRTANVIRDCAA